MSASIVKFDAAVNKAANSLLSGKMFSGYKIVALHTYRDAQGKTLFWRVRLENSKGDKVIRPMHCVDGTFKLGEPPAPDDGKPLYGLDRLAANPEAIVYVVEGEACTDALHALGLVAVTSGSSSSAGKADWSPLEGRTVVLWPDHDDAGMRYAEHVAELLGELDCDVCMVALAVVDALPEGGDCVDWLGANPKASADDVLGLPTEDAPEPLPPLDLSEDGMALRIGAEVLNDDWRWVGPWSRWMHWTGARWEPVDKVAMFALARNAIRDMTSALEEPARFRTAQKVANVEKMLRSNDGVLAASDQWNQDPMLIGTPAGVVDLRTGELRPAQRGDYITKLTAVAPTKGPCPVWDNFMARIFKREPDIVPFLRRVAGYALTGSTIEHAFVFMFGTGANGKSTLLNILTRLLGEYAVVAPSTTFLESNSSGHPTDLASLDGARLVIANELPPGRGWDVARIKSLASGDPITARRIRQDFYTYVPQFTLLIAGNHQPRFRGVDAAVRRRLLLVPFAETIPEHERDPALFDKLVAELPQIFQWCIDGALEWQQSGLAAPPSVNAASAAYLAEEDVLGQFIEDCLTKKPGGFATSGDTYTAYRLWAEHQGGGVWSQKALTQALIERGFDYTRKRDGRGFAGYVVNPMKPRRF